MNTPTIESLTSEIIDLESALERADDGCQRTRLELGIASRRRQIAELRRQARGQQR